MLFTGPLNALLAAREFTHRWRYVLLLIFAYCLVNVLWGELTKVRGAQQVNYVASTKNCGIDGAVRYCVHGAQTGSNGDIVYHLHGRNLNEHIWNDDTYYTSMVQSQWERSGVIPPKVVTISYGPTWLLTLKGEKKASGLLEDFISHLPSIETNIGAPRRRILLGESMGGLNVLVAGLNYPTEFDKVAALCPGVYLMSPFSSFGTMQQAVKRTGADPKIAFGVWFLARHYIANDSEWENFSPVELIENADEEYPDLYLSNGLYDSYGNYEGTARLAQAAASKGVEVEWRPLYGGHCSIDVPSLAQFLAD